MKPPFVGASATAMLLTPPPCERITFNGNSLGDSDADQVDCAWPGELVNISTTDWGRFKSKENQLSYNSFRCGKTDGFMLSSK